MDEQVDRRLVARHRLFEQRSIERRAALVSAATTGSTLPSRVSTKGMPLQLRPSPSPSDAPRVLNASSMWLTHLQLRSAATRSVASRRAAFHATRARTGSCACTAGRERAHAVMPSLLALSVGAALLAASHRNVARDAPAPSTPPPPPPCLPPSLPPSSPPDLSLARAPRWASRLGGWLCARGHRPCLPGPAKW